MAPSLRRVAVTIGALAALVGCSTSSGSEDPSVPPSPTGESTAVSPPRSRPPTVSATPSPPPTPTSPASPSSTSPADGTRLSACADGQCEVSVGAGDEVPVPEEPFGAPVMNVTKIDNGEVTLEWRRGDGSRTSITLLSPDGGLQLDGYDLTVTVQGKRAVLRITKSDTSAR